MSELFLALGLAVFPITTDDVEVIELNHVYSESGQHQLDQFIFWRDGKIVAWRMAGSRRRATKAENEAYRKAWRARLPKKVKHRPGDVWAPGVIPRDYVRPESPGYVPPYAGPAVQKRNGRWVLIFHDSGRLRQVTAGACRVTWTQYDVEVARREINKAEEREGLSK